ncbi:hypothetical protein M3Y97_00736000 [Aphelenchoides bicaudatus]|nr:hypothetical protein M3Y97_00736000 [Aphelenchoides bicaudatus]
MIGPKCSGTLVFLSIWGIIFMGILGALYKNKSVGLFEDLPGIGDMKVMDHAKINKLYDDNAMKCWIGCGVYAVVLVASGIRFYMVIR